MRLEEFFFLEIFCGTGRFTSCIREGGLVDSLASDSIKLVGLGYSDSLNPKQIREAIWATWAP